MTATLPDVAAKKKQEHRHVRPVPRAPDHGDRRLQCQRTGARPGAPAPQTAKGFRSTRRSSR
jgi:hypothetical protein